ncbi:hypothetical protein HanRHA438_Chr01g0006451 [Helianthus annuus]|nr:hypothetical protein HanRHA438_Chr01g0006451 [Helianthus annuus]
MGSTFGHSTTDGFTVGGTKAPICFNTGRSSRCSFFKFSHVVLLSISVHKFFILSHDRMSIILMYANLELEDIMCSKFEQFSTLRVSSLMGSLFVVTKFFKLFAPEIHKVFKPSGILNSASSCFTLGHSQILRACKDCGSSPPKSSILSQYLISRTSRFFGRHDDENTLVSSRQLSIYKLFKESKPLNGCFPLYIVFNFLLLRSDKSSKGILNSGLSLFGSFSGFSLFGSFSGLSLFNSFSGLSVFGCFSGLLVFGSFSDLSLFGSFSGLSLFGSFSGLSVFGCFSGLLVFGSFSDLSLFGSFLGLSLFGSFSWKTVTISLHFSIQHPFKLGSIDTSKSDGMPLSL